MAKRLGIKPRKTDKSISKDEDKHYLDTITTKCEEYIEDITIPHITDTYQKPLTNKSNPNDYGAYHDEKFRKVIGSSFPWNPHDIVDKIYDGVFNVPQNSEQKCIVYCLMCNKIYGPISWKNICTKNFFIPFDKKDHYRFHFSYHYPILINRINYGIRINNESCHMTYMLCSAKCSIKFITTNGLKCIGCSKNIDSISIANGTILYEDDVFTKSTISEYPCTVIADLAIESACSKKCYNDKLYIACAAWYLVKHSSDRPMSSTYGKNFKFTYWKDAPSLEFLDGKVKDNMELYKGNRTVLNTYPLDNKIYNHINMICENIFCGNYDCMYKTFNLIKKKYDNSIFTRGDLQDYFSTVKETIVYSQKDMNYNKLYRSLIDYVLELNHKWNQVRNSH